MEQRRNFTRAARNRIAIVAAGAFAAGPAQAAQWLADIEWRSYLDWHSYSDLQLWLLGGSIALLVVALILKAFAEPNPSQDSESERASRRIGTMPLEPAKSAEGVV